jgi:4,4'-diaponeurosporenoate glycosyltransferase
MTLTALTLALWCAGWLVLGRLPTVCHAARESPGEAATLRALALRLSIVIPARNEEATLPKLLGSITAQSVLPREVIVVDDASTDQTAAVAKEHGARVVASQPLPEGWRGKTWACHQGAQAATGDLLLFLDADTWWEPEGLARVLEEFELAAVGAMSVAPHHVMRRFHEHFSAFFNLVMLAGTGAFTLLGDWIRPRGLLGQSLLIERTAYERVGGHAAVKDRILENFCLAKRLHAAGVALRCRTGKGVFSFRMYPNGWRELIEGWTKGFAGGAGQTPPFILWLVVAWMTGLMLAAAALARAQPVWAGLAIYLLSAGQVSWLLRQAGTFHPLTALLYPAPLAFFFVVFMRSLWRAKRGGQVEWKGRKIRAG